MDQTDQTINAQDVSQILPILVDICDTLDTGLKNIEPGFGTLGQALQTVYAESESMTAGITALTQAMTDKTEDSMLAGIETIVKDALQVLTGCRQTVSDSLNDIILGTGHLTQLSSICEKLKKSARFLNTIGMNISVEGSRNQTATRMFGNFGKEIKTLAKNIDTITSTIQSDSRKIQSDHSAVHGQVTQGMKTFDSLSSATQEAVESAREKITSIGSIAAMTLEQAGDHSQQISGVVGQVVMSIQFHDIARQQVEHIISAVNDVTALLTEVVTGSGTPNPKDQFHSRQKGQAYSVLTLQAAQLEQVISEAKTVYQKIMDAFEDIGRKINILIENVTVQDARNMDGMELEHEISNFREKLDTLGQLLSTGDDLEDKIAGAMQRSSQAVATLSQYTDQVSNINIDLQYKAINAMIMTNKLGSKGATLGVLARNVRDLSTVSNTQISEILEVISAIVTLADPAAPDDAAPMQTAGNISRLTTALEQGSSRVADEFSQYQATCRQAGEKAREIIDSIDRTRQNLDFLQTWIHLSDEVLDTLSSLLETLDDWKSHAGDMTDKDDDQIARRYTMESERRIHEQLTGSAGKTADRKDPDDDLDDNIELF